jgi:hypothetical protein
MLAPAFDPAAQIGTAHRQGKLQIGKSVLSERVSCGAFLFPKISSFWNGKISGKAQLPRADEAATRGQAMP